MEIIHIADFYNNNTGHALYGVVERLAKKQKIKVYTSKENFITIPYDDSKSDAEIIRFKSFQLGSKAIFLGLTPKLLFSKSPAIIHSYVMGFYSTFVPCSRLPLSRSTSPGQSTAPTLPFPAWPWPRPGLLKR